MNIKGISSFLDHAGFYRRFIKDISQISRPLTNLLANDVPFEFTDECLDTFHTLKKAFICNTSGVTSLLSIEIETQEGLAKQVFGF